jgi:putative membrane protein
MAQDGGFPDVQSPWASRCYPDIAQRGQFAGRSRSQPTDPQIAHIAYTAGVLDVEAGKLALEKSANKDVRAFAQQMIGDHTAVNDQALALVKKLNVTPEDNPTSQSLTKQEDAIRKKLSGLTGAAFDKAYVDK